MTRNVAAIAKVDVDVTKCQWNRAMLTSFQERRLSILSPAKGKGKNFKTFTTSTATAPAAKVTAKKKQAVPASSSTKRLLSDSESDSDDDFETMSLAQRMVRSICVLQLSSQPAVKK